MAEVSYVKGNHLLAIVNQIIVLFGWDIAVVPRSVTLDMLRMANAYHDMAHDLLKAANPEWSMFYNHEDKKVEIIGTKH